MKKIRAFFYVFIKSITSPVYYRDVIKTNMAFSLKYYGILALLASLITASALSVQTIPEMNKTISELVTQAKSAFPVDLKFTSNNNEWNVNRPMPFIVPMPEDTESAEDTPKNLIVFDKEGTIEDLDRYETLIIVNKTNLITRDSQGVRAYPLKELPNGEIGKAQFDGFIDQLAKFAKVLPYIVFAAIFLGMIFYYLVLRAGYLLLIAVLVLLMSRINKTNLDFTNSFKVGLHAMTLPVVLGTVFVSTGTDFPVSSWFIILNTILAGIALFAIKNGKDNTEITN